MNLKLDPSQPRLTDTSRVDAPIAPADVAHVDEVKTPTSDTKVGDSAFVGTVSGDKKPKSVEGNAGTAMSESGFKLLSDEDARAQKRSGRLEAAATLLLHATAGGLALAGLWPAAAAAFGIALLLPLVGGQVKHKGLMPKAVKSPLAALMMQKGAVGTGNDARHAAKKIMDDVLAANGPAREAAVTKLLQLALSVRGKAGQADALVADSTKIMNGLRDQVGIDARLGWVADVYWWGVPDHNQVFHKGQFDLDDTKDVAGDLDKAAGQVNTAGRAAVSDLLYDTVPDFHALRDQFEVVNHKVEVADRLEDLARDADSALSSVESAIFTRNMTPETVTVHDYQDRVTHNQDGTTSTDRVHVGSHEERNPAYDTAVAMVLHAKSSAESAMRDVNRGVEDAKQTFSAAELEHIDTNLIGLLDFFGQPHFFTWSYDQGDVDQAQSQVQRVMSQADRLGDSVRPERDRLFGEVEAAVDDKSAQLLA